MKKIISLLLALIMMFSMCTVAFAADDAATNDTTASEGTETEGEAAEDEEEAILGEYDWILDLPFGTVKPALKIAKIVLKLAKVYVKLGVIFGIIDKDALVEQIGDFIGGLIGGEEAPAPETQEPAPEESTAPAAA